MYKDEIKQIIYEFLDNVKWLLLKDVEIKE